MTREIERSGIPIVHCCNLVNIAEGIGSNRILKGKSVLFPLGDPECSEQAEYSLREGMLAQALNMLEAP